MVKFKPELERRHPVAERIIAVIALINLGLVFFNLTYLDLRPFYRRYVPALTQVYDPIKGIEAHPQTEYFQAQVDTLERQLAQNEVRSQPVEATLSTLRLLSRQWMTEPIFVSPHGADALATLQQRLQARTGQPFSQNVFDQFWSADYLEQQGWQAELAFWKRQIHPYLRSNYYRQVNPWRVPADYFWLLDLPFMLIFAADIWVRMSRMRRRHPTLTRLDVLLRRWYDVFLFLPFWRWLRVIPVALRLYHVDLLDLEPIRAEAQRDIIVTVGADLAGIVGIEIIDQMEESIRQGDLLDWLASTPLATDSDASAVAQKEVLAIANYLYDVSVHRVLPRIQPDLEDLIQHSLTKTLEQVPGYPQLHQMPGVGPASIQVVQQLSNSLVQGLSHSVRGGLLDAEGQALISRLQHNLREAIVDAFKQQNTPQEIQTRLLDVLETFKFKYVKALAETGGETLAERTEQLRRQIS